MLAGMSAGHCQDKGTEDATALIDSSIEHSSESLRGLFPNLLDNPRHRVNEQRKGDSMLMFGLPLVLVALAIPFVTSLVASWAWAARGIAVSTAGGLLVALAIAFGASGAAARPLPAVGMTAGSIFLVWLVTSIPAVITGLAVRKIARRPTPE
jgi:hypothetical protein